MKTKELKHNITRLYLCLINIWTCVYFRYTYLGVRHQRTEQINLHYKPYQSKTQTHTQFDQKEKKIE